MSVTTFPIHSFRDLPPVAPVERRTLTTKEVCAAIPCSTATLYRWAQRGKVTPIKLGRATRWPVSILDDAAAGRLA